MHQSNVFDHFYVFFIHWTSKVNVKIRTQYFDSRFVYIWKVVDIQKTKLPVAITNIIYLSIGQNWRTAFSWTWFYYVLLDLLLPTLFIVLLDGPLLTLCQLCCHVHYMNLNFSTQWNPIRQRNRRWKAALELGTWISLYFQSSHFQN